MVDEMNRLQEMLGFEQLHCGQDDTYHAVYSGNLLRKDDAAAAISRTIDITRLSAIDPSVMRKLLPGSTNGSRNSWIFRRHTYPLFSARADCRTVITTSSVHSWASRFENVSGTAKGIRGHRKRWKALSEPYS